MLDTLFSGVTVRQILFAITVVLLFAIVAWITRFLMLKILKKMVKKTRNKLDDAIFTVLRRPVILIVVILGFYIAAATLPQDAGPWADISRGLATLMSLLAIYLGVVIFNTLINWYHRSVSAGRKNVGFSVRLLKSGRVLLIIASLCLGVLAALSIWGIKVNAVTRWLGGHGWRMALIIGLTMVLIIVIGEVVPRLVIHTLSRRPDENDTEVKKRSDTLSRVLVSTFQIFVILIGVFMILSELNIQIIPILASASVVGVALGFGAQSLVRDILGGLFIILESQYRVGDVVRIADVAGVVENINLRRTVLRDLDGIVHIVPNGEIRVASNFTKEVSRVNLNVSVSYNEDLDRVISVINEVGRELAEDPVWEPLIIKAPKVLRVDNFADSGIEIKITGDTQPIKQWDVTGELRLRLKKAFDKEGIEIPWPHTKVFFGNVPEYPPQFQTSKEK